VLKDREVRGQQTEVASVEELGWLAWATYVNC